MRWCFVIRIQQWYVLFSAGVFFAIIMLSGLFQPIFNNAQPIDKLTPIFHGNTSNSKVAFACNVFWGEEYLPTMLKTLDDNNIKITFFIGGSWAKRFPALVTELGNRGHELGNHTYSHPHPNTISKEKNREQILRTEELVKELTTLKTSLYAPPYGEYNDTVLSAANELGYTTIMWSIDTIDWQRPSTEVVINRVMKKLHPGAIILIHPTDVTSKALPELIKQIQEKGYTISTVSDIIK